MRRLIFNAAAPCPYSCGGQTVMSWIINTSSVPILCSTLRNKAFGMTSRGQQTLYEAGEKEEADKVYLWNETKMGIRKGAGENFESYKKNKFHHSK